jgi:hypothetical protein
LPAPSQSKPPERDSAEPLYDHLMELHDQLFAAERLETAYHVLAGALHLAEELNDLERLTAIETLARARQVEVDRNQSVHAMSSASAHTRGSLARFNTLALTAKAACGRIKADRVVQRSRATNSL